MTATEREREGKNGEKKRGMSPEEMMKPKNDCQREKEGGREKDGGKKRKTDCLGVDSKRVEGGMERLKSLTAIEGFGFK